MLALGRLASHRIHGYSNKGSYQGSMSAVLSDRESQSQHGIRGMFCVCVGLKENHRDTSHLGRPPF